MSQTFALGALQTILASAPNAICALAGPDLEVAEINDAFAEFTETTSSNLLGKRLRFANQAITQTVHSHALAVFNSGQAACDNKLFMPYEGGVKIISIDLQYHPILGENNMVQGVLLVGTPSPLKDNQQELEADNEKLGAANEELQVMNEEMAQMQARLEETIAEVAIREHELRAEQEKLQRFFLQAPAAICVLSGPELRYELVNPLYQQFFPGRELLGQPLFEAVPEIIGSPIADIITNVYATGETYEGRELLIPLAQTTGDAIKDRYFNFIYQARLDAEHHIDGILVFAIEVTEMVRVRQRVEQSEQGLQKLLDGIPHIAWTNTLDGEVDFFNQQWYEYTGLDFNQTRNWAWQKVLHADDLKPTVDAYKNALKQSKGLEFENREKRHDGTYRWHLVRMVPIKSSTGEIERWLGTATDIHELKSLQQAKDDFISIASHELKTPVTSLKASLQLLERMKDDPTPMLSKLISQGNRSIAKISSLIEDLLDAGRVNQAQLHLKKTRFNASLMINGCCDHIRSAGIHQLVFQGDDTLEIYADEHRLDQVLINLVNNAVKYAPESKEIFLILEKLEHGTKISVRDNGPGISAEKIPRLFGRYYRTDYAMDHNSGLGLGLYISSEIIHRHGGELGADSVPGEGSTFWFTIPDEAPDEQAASISNH